MKTKSLRFNPCYPCHPWLALRAFLHSCSFASIRGCSAVFANIAEGTHNGNITKKTDAAIATRFLFAKLGSDDDHFAVCTADTDKPIGVFTDEASAAEELINVALLGAAMETRKITLGGTVALGDYLVTDTAAKGKKLPTAAGTYYIVGRALAAGVSGDVIEFDPIPAVQRVV